MLNSTLRVYSGIRAEARSLSFRAAFLLLATGLAGSAHANTDPPVRTLEAHSVAAPISVDGRLDEADWQHAAVATDFVQFEPDPGATASTRTEVRVLYGPGAIYVGARLFDDPRNVRAPLSRRNSAGEADLFTVTIDGHGTGRTAFIFGVTAANVQLDAIRETDRTDYSWDAVWDSAVRITDDGWTVEMAIPYSMLRFPNAPDQTWWIQFERVSSRSGERVFWQPVSLEDELIGFIAGRLTGLRGISPRANIQVRPYTLSRVTRAPVAGLGPGFANDTGFDVGADVKIGLGSNLIFDATINPDFGQVEADPEVLNLTTFETFFPEQRPFFLEGTSIFDYSFAPDAGPILYTRRIGGLGRIVGAGKLTGQTRSGVSFGVMAATTSDGFEGPETFTGEDFEPDLLYTAARIKREFGDRSFVGGAVTYFDGYGSAWPGDHVRSLVGGTDFDLRLLDGTYRWEGALTMSHRSFKEEAFSDQTGFALYSGLDRVRGLLTGGVGLRIYSDQFQPNDLGFFREDNVIQVRGHAQRLLNEGRPFGPFRLAFVGGSVDQNFTFAGSTNLGMGGRWYSFWNFRDYQRLIVRGVFASVGGYDVRESRGLGAVKNLAGAGMTLDYSTDTRRDLVVSPRVNYGLFQEGGRAGFVELVASWTASDRLWFSTRTRYQQIDGVRAWVANETIRRDDTGFFVHTLPNRFPGGTDSLYPFFGEPATYEALFNRLNPLVAGEGFSDYYVAVFGARDQRSIDTSLRANYTFRPNLSLQLYSQLFAARFQHGDFQLLIDPDHLEPVDGYPRRRDETRRSLNLNSVVRWEYRPGSTFFLVWAHGRQGFDGGYYTVSPNSTLASPFDRGTFRLAMDTFDLQPTNVVLIKLNYLLMR